MNRWRSDDIGSVDLYVEPPRELEALGTQSAWKGKVVVLPIPTSIDGRSRG